MLKTIQGVIADLKSVWTLLLNIILRLNGNSNDSHLHLSKVMLSFEYAISTTFELCSFASVNRLLIEISKPL